MTSTPSHTGSRASGARQAAWIHATEIIGCALFFLLIGLAFSQTIQIQFTLPKLMWLWFGAAGLAALWVLRFTSGGVKRVPALIVVPAVVLVGWWALTTLLAADPATALYGMRGRYNGLLTQTTLVAIFLAVASADMSRRKLRGLVTLFVIALVPVAAYAIAQDFGVDPYVWPNPRPGSTIGHPVPLAAILSLAIPFVMAFLLTERESNAWWTWASVLALFSFAAAATLSRGPWAGLIVGSGIVVIAAARGRVITFKGSTVWWTAIGLAGALALLWNSAAIARISLRLMQIARVQADPSFAGRFVYLDAAFRMIRDHPFAGVGLENYGLLYPRYRPLESEIIPPDAVPTMVHNGYVQAAATTGLPGLVFHLAFVTALLILLTRALPRIAGWRDTKQHLAPDGARDWMIAVAFVGAICGYLVQDLSGWQEISLSVFFWTVAGAAVSFCTSAEASERLVHPKVRASVAAAVILMGAGLMALGFQARRAITADRAFFASHLLDPVRDWPVIEQNLAAGLRLAADDPYYQDAAGVLYLRRFHATGERAAYQRSAEFFEQARRANAFDPYILIHHIDLETAALERQLIRSPADGVVRAAADVVEMDPNNSSVYEAAARLRFAEGKWSEALASIERAIALRPHHPRYHALQGDARRALGDLSRACESYRQEALLLVERGPDWLNAEHRLMVTLIEAAQFDAVVAEGHSVVEQTPGDDLAYSLMGIAQQSMNQLDPARESFAQALRINPGNASARQALQAPPGQQR